MEYLKFVMGDDVMSTARALPAAKPAAAKKNASRKAATPAAVPAKIAKLGPEMVELFRAAQAVKHLF